MAGLLAVPVKVKTVKVSKHKIQGQIHSLFSETVPLKGQFTPKLKVLFLRTQNQAVILSLSSNSQSEERLIIIGETDTECPVLKESEKGDNNNNIEMFSVT